MRFKKAVKTIFVICAMVAFVPSAAWSEGVGGWPDPWTYLPSPDDMMKVKASYDDQRDLFKTYHPKDILAPEIWAKLHWDPEQMSKLWEELLGFKAPDVVGKIAPEIKPGKYTYKDLEQNPGFKELFPEYVYKTIKPGGPPIICNIMDFELQPTKQFYMALPTAEFTKKNLGKTKLDKDGYIVAGTWEGGYPFPRPSGPFKAQQVYYNFEKKMTNYQDTYLLAGEGLALDKNLEMDKYNKYERRIATLMGRTFMEPYGWFDKRAEKRGEFNTDVSIIYEPRANRGLVVLLLRYDDPQKMDPYMMYLPQLRRIRKMSSTDTQDPSGDAAYDDYGFLRQKITPKRFPYKFEITAEREYLCPFSYNSGPSWVDSKNGKALRDLGLMRRPCYVLQMTQQDPNYIYSKRIYYIDKETFIPGWGEFYDQKGRLYRTYNIARTFMPEVGQIVSHGTQAWQVDYVDSHSSFQVLTCIPANWGRGDFNMKNLVREGK